MILHLMTQRGQPYGSERRCCERCGLMMVSRPAAFWEGHAYVTEERHYVPWPAGYGGRFSEITPCDQQPKSAP